MNWVFVTVVLLEILAGAEVDLFVPSFPEIQSIFHLSIVQVELMLVTNFIAYGISAFIIGNFGDKYGSRIIIIWSLIIFIGGSAACILSDSYIYVLCGRVLQGLGVAGPIVLSYVIIAELHKISEQQRLMCMMSGWTTLAMAFAPIIGSYINLFYGWRGNFIILLVFGVISLLMTTVFLPKARTNNSHVNISLREYLPLLTSSQSLSFIVTLCFLCAPYWVFTGIAPIFYREELGVPLEEFGYYQGSISLVFGTLCLCSDRLIKFYGIKRCFNVSLILSLVSIAMLAALGFYETRSPLLITIVLIMTVSSVMFPINILYPLSLDIMPNAKGRMASVIQSARLLLTAMCLHATSYFYNGTFYYIAIILIITLSIGSYGAWRISAQNWSKIKYE